MLETPSLCLEQDKKRLRIVRTLPPTYDLINPFEYAESHEERKKPVSFGLPGRFFDRIADRTGLVPKGSELADTLLIKQRERNYRWQLSLFHVVDRVMGPDSLLLPIQPPSNPKTPPS